MKDKIILFVIGVLVGAVIATGAFYVYTISSNNCSNNSTTQNAGQPPEMPSGQNGQNSNNGQPPEIPSNNTNNQTSNS